MKNRNKKILPKLLFFVVLYYLWILNFIYYCDYELDTLNSSVFEKSLMVVWFFSHVFLFLIIGKYFFKFVDKYKLF